MILNECLSMEKWLLFPTETPVTWHMNEEMPDLSMGNLDWSQMITSELLSILHVHLGKDHYSCDTGAGEFIRCTEKLHRPPLSDSYESYIAPLAGGKKVTSPQVAPTLRWRLGTAHMLASYYCFKQFSLHRDMTNCVHFWWKIKIKVAHCHEVSARRSP